jgi:O-antigen ligase
VLYDKRLLIPAAIIVIVAIPFMPEAVINRIFTIGSLEDSSNSYRLYIWDSCFRMVKDFFVTGIGLGPSSFRVVYPDYAEPFAITAPHSHMLYMELILETGLLGFVSFFAYMFTVVKSAAGAMRKCDIQTKCVIIASLSALLGIAFVCCAEYIWFYPRVLFAFWIIPGIMMAAKRTGTR